MTVAPRTIALGALGIAGLVVALVLVLTGGDDEPKPTAASNTATAVEVVSPAATTPTPQVASPAAKPATGSGEGSAATETAPSIDDVMQAKQDPSADATIVLLSATESTDAIVVAEATNALVARGTVAALPILIESDVIRRPWAAPSVIDAMGRLAALAPPEQRGEAVDRLVALMREEKVRGAQESLGNLIQIYEALGLTGDPRAIAPLEGELVDPTVPTAPKVVVVQALVALRAIQSRPVLERVQAQLAASPAKDAYEAELQKDLIAAIRDALVQLS